MSQLNSYIPESLFMEGKNTEHARLCSEDCALVDPENQYRVIAARGKEIPIGKAFVPLQHLSDSESEFLLRALCDKKRMVLMGDAGTILIFADWFYATGLLLAVCPRCESHSVCRVLRLLGRGDFAFSPACQSISDEPRRSDAEAYGQLNELLYYLERIFAPSDAVPLWTRTKLIANFAGCRAECNALRAKLPPLLKSDETRLCAFLMCLFLSSRAIGEVKTGVQERDRTIVYQAELCDPYKTPDACDLFPFMRLPAFESIALRKSEDGWVLETNLHCVEEKIGVFAAQPVSIGLRISFRFSA